MTLKVEMTVLALEKFIRVCSGRWPFQLQCPQQTVTFQNLLVFLQRDSNPFHGQSLQRGAQGFQAVPFDDDNAILKLNLDNLF
jgi:hypothetical protein